MVNLCLFYSNVMRNICFLYQLGVIIHIHFQKSHSSAGPSAAENSLKISSKIADPYLELSSEDNLFLYRKGSWIPFNLEPSLTLRVKPNIPFGLSPEADMSILDEGSPGSSLSKVIIF